MDLKNMSWGPRYLLMVFSHLCSGKINNVVSNKTVKDLSKESSLSEKSVCNYIHELKEGSFIGVERDVIFGKGRGVNSYRLYEKFELKLRSVETYNLIINRVLFISDLKPIQKFILICLINKSDDFGVVLNMGFSKLMKVTGISRSALKTNLQTIINSNFVFGYTSGGSLPIFPKNMKGAFYLNYCRYKQSEIKPSNVLIESKDTVFGLERRFNKGVDFLDIDVKEYFDFYVCKEVKQYLKALNESSKQMFIDIVSQIVDQFSGDLLQIVRQRDLEKDVDFKLLIEELKNSAFKVSIGPRIDNFNPEAFRLCIDAINDNKWSELYNSINSTLFDKNNSTFDLNDELESLRKSVFDEIRYLINYFTFATYFKLIHSSSFLCEYAIVRNKDLETGLTHPVLLQKRLIDFL